MSQEETGTKKPLRRFKRVPQHLAVDLRFNGDGVPNARKSPSVRGIATDLGPGGMQILMGEAHQVGTHLTIEMTLDGTAYSLGAIVRHLRWVSATPGMMFGHGVEIVEVSESTMRAIISHLSTYMTRRPATLQKAA